MEAFSAIVVLLSMVGFVLSLLGIIKGSIKFLRIRGRKNSLFLLISCFVLFIIGVLIFPTDTSTVSQTNTQQEEGSVVTSDIKETSDNVKSSATNESAEDAKSTNDNEQVDVLPMPVLKEEPVIKEQKDSENPTTPAGILKVHYIDVGQGAAQLIISPSGKVMLIDGGNNDYEQRMVDYLKEQGVKKVDILIGTHPDADHIGGLDAVVDAFEIGSIYMPKVSSNTKTFESLLTSISNKNLKVTTAKAGIDLKLDDQLIVKMIAPINTYDSSNEMSAVIKLTFGSNSFLFTGDAESKSENDLLANGTNLKSDVLLVGHHGSNSSTTQSFLDAVDPTYAVIQVGKNNYGHPTSNILKRLTDKKIKIYRNDKQGNIVFTSDGSKISVSQDEWKASTDTTTTTTTKPKVTEAPKATPKVETPVVEKPKQDTTEVYYKNCTAAREAGAAPIYKGEPGYSTKLDRDGDGVACE